MIYELHDFDTANMIAAADMEGAALTTVAAHGHVAAETWVLLRVSTDGMHKEMIVAGEALAERALHAPGRGDN